METDQGTPGLDIQTAQDSNSAPSPCPRGADRPSRAWIIGSRWFSVFSTGVVAAAIWLLAEPFLGPLCTSAVDRLAAIPPIVIVATTLVLTAAAVWPMARARWVGWLGLRHFFCYPPLWVAVCTALITLDLYHIYVSGRQTVSPPLSAATGVGGLLLGFVATGAMSLHRRRSAKRNRPADDAEDAEFDEGTSLADRLPSFEKIREWLRDDCEITHPRLDMFGHDVVARRIVRRLREDNSADCPTIAVVGPLGSGKSSIARLVSHHLSSKDDMRMVRVSLWPFDSPEAAVRGILDSLVSGLSEHVNALSLRGLSRQYLSVVEIVGGRPGTIASLIAPPSDPKEVLEKVSAVLQAIDLRIILWIEDLERFSGVEQFPDEEGALRDAERLGPVRAMLHLLDRRPMISVLIADTSLESRFDIDKIARFVERPPPPQVIDTWHLVGAVRRACLGGYPKDIIDPVAKASREALEPPVAKFEAYQILGAMSRQDPKPPHALAMVLDTPRALKDGLRLALDIWMALAGEIDFDDVLVMSAIRVARPNLFAFIDRHISLFRRGFTEFAQKGEPSEHPKFKELLDLLNRESRAIPPNALKSLIHFVFPALPEPRVQHDADSIYADYPQSLAVERHVDYWSRYMSASPVGEKKSDQAALRSVRAWRGKEPNDLLDRVLNPETSDQIETFVRLFKPSELCTLLEEVATKAALKDAASWSDPSDAPGVIPIWRMMHRHSPDPTLLCETIESCIRAYIGTHLPLAYSILYYFGGPGSGTVPPLLQETERRRVVVAARDALLQLCTLASAEHVVEARKNGSPWVFFWITQVFTSGVPDNTNGLPFESWEQFSTLLLDLAEQNPAVGLPQIVPFVTEGKHRAVRSFNKETEIHERRMQYSAHFDEPTAKKRFDLARLLPLLAKATIPDDLEPQMAEHFRAAQNAARIALDGSG